LKGVTWKWFLEKNFVGLDLKGWLEDRLEGIGVI